MRPLVSVIIPVYNVGEYIEQCLRSVMSQSYSNLEIIVVDDGSTDSTFDICSRLAQEDNRILIIHIENSGVSVARNVALKNAKGEYIGFIDGDDLIEPKMYEILMNQMSASTSDIVICGFDNKEHITHCSLETVWKEYTSDVFMEQSFFSSTVQVERTLWHMLFKRKTLEGLQFDSDLINGEDNLFILKAYLKAENISLTSKVLYHYIKRKNSLTTSNFSKEKVVSRFESSMRQAQILQEKYPKHLKQIKRKALIDCVNFSKKLIENRVQDEELFDRAVSCSKFYVDSCDMSAHGFWIYGNLLACGWKAFYCAYYVVTLIKKLLLRGR